MKIHHLNCGTMCPACERLINGKGSWLKPATLCSHCLLIETAESLVLVDTGFGTADVKHANQRLGHFFQLLTQPKLDLAETAFHQIKALGYSPADVTDIFLTHLDLDHAGGLSDFSQAHVHVHKTELDYALKPSIRDRLRYRKAQLTHQAKWQTYAYPEEDWYGLKSFDCSEKLDFEIRMVPLIGHTWGHVGVAIKHDNQWMMHCGDAYFHHSQLTTPSDMPLGLAIFEKQVETQRILRLDNLKKLQQLKMDHPDIELFCAHDMTEFERLKNLHQHLT